tara:strand:+ start:2922 stop:4109 length:1188 start_codon:yes stop_codon:yes gene_type:complete
VKHLKVIKYRDYFTINGSRIGLQRRHGHYPTKAIATEEAAKLLAKHTLGQLDEVIEYKNLKQCAKVFIDYENDRLDLGKIAAETLEDTKRAVRFLIGEFEDQPSKDRIKTYEGIKIGGTHLSKLDLKNFNRTNKDQIAVKIESHIQGDANTKSTAHKRVKGAKQFFKFCVRKGWIIINPLEEVNIDVHEEYKDKAPIISELNVKKIIKDGLKGEDFLHQVAVILSLSTGIRQQELRALKWADIHFDDSGIHITKAVKHKTKIINKTKTKRGVRFIAVDEVVLNKLRELKISTRYSADDDLVFATSNGTIKESKTLRELAKRISKRAGVKYIKWGDHRHYQASSLLRGLGADWAEVSSVLGHSNPTFTYKQYGHTIRNTLKSAKTSNISAKSIGLK